jgi:hypothetical protein
MTKEMPQQLMYLKHRILNEHEGASPEYTTYKHINGGISISGQLVDIMMQEAYAEGHRQGYEDGYDDVRSDLRV